MSDQLLSIGNTVAWLVDVLDKIIFNWLNSYSSQVSTWKLCARLMLKSVATIIVVTNLIPNGPSKAAFMGSRFERCIVILTDNIFFIWKSVCSWGVAVHMNGHGAKCKKNHAFPDIRFKC